jgi:hypothetical protein
VRVGLPAVLARPEARVARTLRCLSSSPVLLECKKRRDERWVAGSLAAAGRRSARFHSHHLTALALLPFRSPTPAHPLVRCSAIEKFGNMKPPKYDLAAKQVKETMDKRYAPNWCCIIGLFKFSPHICRLLAVQLVLVLLLCVSREEASSRVK